MRLRALLLVLPVLAAMGCGKKCPDEDTCRAQKVFGSKMSVSGFDVSVPEAHVFLAVPDPAPSDYDGFDAVLLPTKGAPLRDADAVRFAWDHGVRDADRLAKLSAVFLVGSQQVAHREQQEAGYIRNHELITPPELDGTRLIFWAVRGGMAPEASQYTVDLTTFKATRSP